MELNLKLKEWRNQQHESEQLQQQQQQHGSVLPLFVTERQQQEQNNNIKHNNNNNNLSAFSESSSTPTRLFSRMGSYFNPAQWQELELQALIYRYMLAGADVPAELLYPIKKSLFNSSQFYLHQHPLYQPALLQPAGYWGRGALDPEPGRCRRTDGKKWRCSRDVVAAHKYCERHMHRGRNRSRKPVETTATLAVGNQGACGLFSKTSATITASPLSSNNADKMSDLGHFSSPAPSSSVGLLQLNPSAGHKVLDRSSKSMTQNISPFESQNEKLSSVDGTSDGRVLRCFFDDWPRSLNDREDATTTNARSTTSTADISLKLSTGTDDSDTTDRSQLNWASSWGAAPVEVAHMGGPLAEALRSSVSNSTTSPNSVLQELQQKSSVSETTSFVST